MKVNKLRIGYVPLTQDYEGPGDKRRFVYYARNKGLPFEIADPKKKYDVIVLTQNADLSVWSEYDLGGAKIVYDYINSYLSVPRYEIKGNLRGLAKYISGQNKYLRLNHWKAIESMCIRADAVICTTEEQDKFIKPFCKNTHVILDIHSFLYRHAKSDYKSNEIFNIVWEGQPANAYAFSTLKEVFSDLESRHELALHFVTDLNHARYCRRYGNISTGDIVKELSKRVYLYEWNELMCAQIICACDLAVIPIDMSNPLVIGKPENKLLLFWRMGMPTVTSSTPAYNRAMLKAGLDMTCLNKKEWINTIERYILDEKIRRIAGTKGQRVVDETYSINKTLKQWDNVFNSIL